MAQQREATTERLVGVIASIKLARRSGQLRVRRGEGLTSEEGILIFAMGQVTQANVGRRNGADALNWLSTWGQARYIFLAATSAEEVSIEFSTPPSATPERNTGVLVARVNTDELETEQPEEAGYEAPHARMELGEATTHIEGANLSRAHRRLYLLIDGHRSVYELAPLLGKKAEEVRSMLHDLESLRVIQIPNFPV
jgi:hypothetical protein